MGSWTLDSTIFALATAPMPGWRMVFRISGPATRSVLDKLFCPDPPHMLEKTRRGAMPGTLTLCGQDVKLRAWVWLFSAPESYTGQDVAEIHVPGSPPLIKMIEQELIEHQLVPAQPGEFTARAYLCGKVDLTEAEGINAMVRAENDAQLQAGLELLKGRLGCALTEMYDELTQLVSLVEANIDFSEEDIELITPDELEQKIGTLGRRIDELLESAIDSETLGVLPRVFLLGPPNAGKSSLLNRLTGMDRAICSSLPGTTRDMLTAVWPARGREVMLVDTAGLDNPTDDELTARAVEHARKYLATADLNVLVFDPTAEPQRQIDRVRAWALAKSKTIAVINKADLPSTSRLDELKHLIENEFARPLLTSALTGAGLVELTDAVFDRLGQSCLTIGCGQLALNRRHRHALHEAQDAMRAASDDLKKIATGTTRFGFEIIAVQLRQSLCPLAELLGKDATENVLDTIFSKFCLGK